MWRHLFRCVCTEHRIRSFSDISFFNCEQTLFRSIQSFHSYICGMWIAETYDSSHISVRLRKEQKYLMTAVLELPPPPCENSNRSIQYWAGSVDKVMRFSSLIRIPVNVTQYTINYLPIWCDITVRLVSVCNQRHSVARKTFKTWPGREYSCRIHYY